MKITSKIVYVLFGLIMIGVFACNESDKKKNKQTILKGSATVLVDETLKPVIEDQIDVFESIYNGADITLSAKSENEVLHTLLKDSSGIAVLSRTLTEEEVKYFERKKINPRVTKFATDAIAFIANKNNKDTLIALQDVIDFMQGKSQGEIKGLVFDNLNSSTVRYMNELAALKTTPTKGIFSFRTNDEVIKFVSENDGMIGIIGVNWLTQPMPAMNQYIQKVNVLSVKGTTTDGYYGPTQNNIAEGKYPLARDLYIINCQGFSGLGMGFASFVAGERGQRIILKSGLLPLRMPGRSIIIKNQNKKK